MLLSSWTRAARGKSAPHLASSVSTSCTSKANLSRPFTPCRPQRRNSSSKPSNSQNGDPSPLAAPSDVESKKTLSTSPSSTPTRKRLSPRTSRQRIRDTILETPQIRHNGIATTVPAVPSTKNLHPHDIHVASFFSIHRPISVTAPVPTNSSISTFSSIFIPKSIARPLPTAEVIYTLSSTVQNLEKATAQADEQSASSPAVHNQDHLEPLRAAVTQASPSNAEPTSSNHLDEQSSQGVLVDLNEVAKRFQPFVPPPPPVPMPTSMMYASQTDRDITQKRGTFRARSPENFEDPQSLLPKVGPFMERMRERHLKWEEYMERSKGEMWRAISVKRQRKLKMKKHKYKKLMRRTRNLRRRLDRL